MMHTVLEMDAVQCPADVNAADPEVLQRPDAAAQLLIQ